MRERIIPLLEKINIDLCCRKVNSSLMSGSAGLNLYHYQFYKHCRNGRYSDVFIDSLNLLIQDSQNPPHSTLAGGKAGINWFFSFLYKEGVIKKRDWKLLTSDDILLSRSSLNYLRNDNYDFLHGALGIAHYLKYIKAKDFTFFFNNFFFQLEKVYRKGDTTFPRYDLHKGAADAKAVDVGFAHGISGVLKFCIDCFKNKLCMLSAYNLSQRIIAFLKENILEHRQNSYFPSFWGDDFPAPFSSRMGWCYGDLIIANTLLEAATAFDDGNLTEFALEILYHSNKRRDFNTTGVDNIAICHGSAGIAHIYNKLWHKTGDISFQESCNFWIRTTVDYYYNNEGGENNFFTNNDNYKTNPTLLTGESGVGLVLLSYLTGDFSWDYCLMLN